LFVGALSLSPMHNSGILERQYWANKKIKNHCENMKKIVNEEANFEKNNQTQLKTTGRNVEGEKKI